MSLMDEARKATDARERAERMSDQDLVNTANNGSGWDKAAARKEYDRRLYERTGGRQGEERPPCFITTAVCDSFGKADDCYELTAFRKFRDNWLINQSDGKSLIDEYYNIAPKIVDKINSLSDSAEIYKNIWRGYLSECLKFIESGDNQQCKKVYISMVNTLKEKFLV